MRSDGRSTSISSGRETGNFTGARNRERGSTFEFMTVVNMLILRSHLPAPLCRRRERVIFEDVVTATFRMGRVYSLYREARGIVNGRIASSI